VAAHFTAEGQRRREDRHVTPSHKSDVRPHGPTWLGPSVRWVYTRGSIAGLTRAPLG
jgi:hypothetical protein